LEPFILVLSLRRANADFDRALSALLRDTTNGRIAKAMPLLEVQEAKPPGGFKGEALTLRSGHAIAAPPATVQLADVPAQAYHLIDR
jgi:hypothetical protein